MNLDVDELRYRLALYRTPGIGGARYLKLLRALGSAKAVFDSREQGLEFAKLPAQTLLALQKPDWDAVAQDLAWAQHKDHHILALDTPDYPPLLAQIADPPPLLFVRGSAKVLSLPQLAVVGSRNPSHQGEENALRFARHLSECGLVITSGLAIGVDGASHRGALQGSGLSVAVNGTGLNSLYPKRHTPLAQEIVDKGGALVSEFPPDAPIARENFPRRNRLISGLSVGTLVVEAAEGSGSLITARFAVEQGREVFAIPGSIHNPLAKGCHALIKQGAKLVEAASDIFEELRHVAPISIASPAPQAARRGERPPLSELEQSIYLCLDFEPVAMDEVIRRSGQAAQTVSSVLLVLELQDIIVSHAGGRYSRVVTEDMRHERECV